MTESPSPRSHQLSAGSWLRMEACKTTCALRWNSSCLCETTRVLCWDTGWLYETNHALRWNSGWLCGTTCALHTGTLAGLSTCRSCTDNHSFCELIGAVVPPCPEDTASLQSSPTSGSHNLSTSFLMVIPEPWGEEEMTQDTDTAAPSVAEHSTDAYSLHFSLL